MAHDKLDLVTILLLVVILVIAAFLTYYSHLNYPFPLHVDEWYHIAMAQYIVQTGTIPNFDFYLSQHIAGADLEPGYHLVLALVDVIFHPSITFWTYLPTILQLVAVLCVFIFVDRLLGRKEALIAAFLIALLPSNVTLGGPVFLIPENLGFIFIPLALLFAFRLVESRPLYNYSALFVIVLFLLYSHPPTALILLFILFFYALLLFFSKDVDSAQQAKYIFGVMVLAGLLSIPNYLPYLQAKGAGAINFGSPVLVAPIPLVYGIVPSIFFIVGLYIFSGKASREMWSLVIIAMLLIVVIFLFVDFNFNFVLPYQRVFMPLFLIMSILAAKGYTLLLELNKKAKNLGSLCLGIALVVTFYFSVHNNLSTPYYHLITTQDYQNFLFIKANFNSSQIVIMNPYTARAFTPITGMRVYSVEPFGPSQAYSALLNNTSNFFAGNCADTAFMRQNNISIVYTTTKCASANLTEVTNDTYVLR